MSLEAVRFSGVILLLAYLLTDSFTHSLTHSLTPWSLPQKLPSRQIGDSTDFMEPEGSSPRSQKPATCPCLEPDRSSPCPQPTLRSSILILSSHLRLGLSSGLFPSGLPTKILYAPLLSHIRATCPTRLCCCKAANYNDFRGMTRSIEYVRNCSSLVSSSCHEM